MKASVYTEFGPPEVLRLKEVKKPSPKDNEVLIKIHAAALNQGDWYALIGKPFMVRITEGLLKPKNKILGMDVAGQIEAVGSNVKQFQPGDEVFGDISWCGKGGYAEYVCVPENLLALKPANISFEQAAAIPVSAVVALQALRDTGQIQSGQKVLINGASGGVGTFMVQIAKYYGAEVTAVCSTGKIDLMRSIGADHAIDYTQEDFTQSGELYNLIIGVNGYRSLSDYKRALTPKGTYVNTGGTMKHLFEAMLKGPLMSKKGGKQLKALGPVKQSQTGLVVLKEILEAGKFIPFIDRRFQLSEVPDAFRYFGEGHAKGKIIITVVDDGELQPAV
jgi:NADPH:quinone reductase-like Zn-dependent oxidoreductase